MVNKRKMSCCITHRNQHYCSHECYQFLKCNFKDCWEETNEISEDGQLKINDGQTTVP